MSNRVVLSANGLSKSYVQGKRSLAILKALDFSIFEGEVVSIMGRSGSGKSTLLNVLAGLDHCDEGSVTLNGFCWQNISEKDRDRARNSSLGFVYQFHHLLPEFSAIENVMMPLLIAGKPRKKSLEVARELLSRVGMSDREDHRPSELSGGERQRVAIARALSNAPALVLMDEPTGNLDEQTASEVRGLIRTLSRESGQSFVIVTHDSQMAEIADRRFKLESGTLQEFSE